MKRPSAASADKPAALLLCPEPPYPMRGGGPLRSAAMLNYLAARYSVDAIFFRQDEEANPAGSVPWGLLANTWTIDLPHHSKGLAAKTARNVRRFLSGRPPLVDRLSGHASKIAQLLAGRRYAVGVIEHFWCAPYQPVLAACCDKVVLNLHNVESVLFERRAATSRWPVSFVHDQFAAASRRLEIHWLPRFHLVLAATAKDARLARQMAPEANVAVYPNTLPWTELPEAGRQKAVVFTGNLEYDPNRVAIRYFQRRIWPILQRLHPDLQWWVIGRNPEAVRHYLNGDNRIRLMGEVDDALAAMAPARVSVVPLLGGSGSRFKIIEAWAAGVPVVSTRIGAEGLPARHGEELLLADGEEDFASAVSAVLQSDDLRERLRRGGRRLYEKEFTWEKGWKALTEAGF